MNMFPMILRFFSGSSTPCRAVKKRSSASMHRKFMPSSPFKRSTTWGDGGGVIALVERYG
jgi:hypothetical protein